MSSITANNLIDLLRNPDVENIKIFKRIGDTILYINDGCTPIELNINDLSIKIRKVQNLFDNYEKIS